jgi:hydrogenase nickel incorporation protein HypA/HybF
VTDIQAVHELALTESVLAIVRERLGPRKIVRVRLQIGERMAVAPDALRFCFELCADGAALEIEEAPGSELLIKEVEVV